MKTCSKCGLEKIETDFRKWRTGCKECEAAAEAKRREDPAYREMQAAAMREKRKDPAVKVADAERMRNLRKNPEYRAAEKITKAEYRADPENHEKELVSGREYRSKFVNKERNRKRMEDKRQDPEFKKGEREKAAERQATQPESVRAVGRKSALKRRRLLNLLKVERGCYDCGGMFPAEVLDWDHLPQFEKTFCIGAQQKAFTLEACIEEIGKCQVVCSNCHRLRTTKRKQEKGVSPV